MANQSNVYVKNVLTDDINVIHNNLDEDKMSQQKIIGNVEKFDANLELIEYNMKKKKWKEILKKIILWGVLWLPLVLGTIAGFLGWITNVIFGYPKWNILRFQPLIEWFKGLQDISLFKELSSINLVVVDLSTVTTCLIFLTMLLATIGTTRVMIGNNLERGEHFPFWPKYVILYVQLGLLGTLFGLIIAFRDISPDQTENTQFILMALGTALWSTFSAIFLAYVLCPYFFEKLLFGRILPHEPGHLGEAGRTEEPIDKLSRSFANLNKEVDKTSEDFNQLSKEIDKHKMARSFSELHQKIETTTKGFTNLSEEINNLESIQEKLDKFFSLSNKISGLKNELEQLISQNQTKINDVEQSLKRTTQTVSDLKERKIDERLSVVEEQLTSTKAEIADIKKTKDIMGKIKNLLKM